MNRFVLEKGVSYTKIVYGTEFDEFFYVNVDFIFFANFPPGTPLGFPMGFQKGAWLKGARNIKIIRPLGPTRPHMGPIMGPQGVVSF